MIFMASTVKETSQTSLEFESSQSHLAVNRLKVMSKKCLNCRKRFCQMKIFSHLKKEA